MGFHAQERAAVRVGTGFHAQEVLAFRFEQEEDAAQLAAQRVAAQRVARERRAREEAVRERESRWYNVKQRHRQRHSRGSGPAKAKRRLKKRRTTQKRKETPWYMREPARSPAADAFALAKAKSKEILGSRKSDVEAAKRALAEREAGIARQLEVVEEARLRALQESKAKPFELQLLGADVGPFLPGPYRNSIESVFAIERVGEPRRFFSSPFHNFHEDKL